MWTRLFTCSGKAQTATRVEYLPDLSVTVSFWGWIWVIWSADTFSLFLLRSVTSLFLLMVTPPRGFSILDALQFLFFRDSRSSQRADLDSPTVRKFCKIAKQDYFSITYFLNLFFGLEMKTFNSWESNLWHYRLKFWSHLQISFSVSREQRKAWTDEQEAWLRIYTRLDAHDIWQHTVENCRQWAHSKGKKSTLT